MTKKLMSVDELIDSLNHPQEETIQVLRRIIKQSSNELVEGVKWNSPSYALNGNDIITFNFHYKGYVSLVFHTEPKGKDTHTNNQLFKDDSNLLEWVEDKRAILKIASIDEIEPIQHDMESIIAIWISKAKNSFLEM